MESGVERAHRPYAGRQSKVAETTGWSARGLVRDVFVAAASAAVIGFLVFYAVSKPDVRFDLTLGAVEPYPAQVAVLHGRIVKADGEGVGAQVTAQRRGAPRQRALTGERGFFRLELRSPCGSYDIAVAAQGSGRSFARRFTRRLCPGQALELDGRIVSTGNFIWIPMR
jgi:hypothetical protein